MPRLKFSAEQKNCPVDKQPLHVQKTGERTIKSVGIGTFKAHHNVLYCKDHPELGCWCSDELAQLAPDNSNVAYNVIVAVGKLRFMENRQVAEIQEILFTRHDITLLISEIELLIDKFIFYVAAVHQQSIHLIREQIKAPGGYLFYISMQLVKAIVPSFCPVSIPCQDLCCTRLKSAAKIKMRLLLF